MKKIISILLFVTIVTAINASCYKDNKESMYPSTGICDTTAVTFGNDIKSIINNSCATSGCHNASAAGGYNLTSYAGVKTMVDNNVFLTVIESGSMPKNASKLDDCSINKVRSWISKGALDN
ncbi:MAG: hypothetical protein IT256_02090 [Chitinophagaceae bacterium]|nr:hypothetical protein [Chitinophagaceae bacterium]